MLVKDVLHLIDYVTSNNAEEDETEVDFGDYNCDHISSEHNNDVIDDDLKNYSLILQAMI